MLHKWVKDINLFGKLMRSDDCITNRTPEYKTEINKRRAYESAPFVFYVKPFKPAKYIYFCGMELICKYFPELTALQKERLEKLYSLYEDWNARINVISRKDFDQLYLRHVLHSLAIAKVCRFEKGAKIMDVGTGGGFPGIPLAILFPETGFTLVDSIGKKINVVKGVAESLRLDNVMAVNGRAEQVGGKFDYVVSRAVTDMSTFIGWVWSKIEAGQKGTLPNGIIYLKGGDLAEELSATRKSCKIYNISDYFSDEFFETKKVVYFRK